MTTNNNPVPTWLDPLRSETVQSVSPGASWLQNKLWGGRGGGVLGPPKLKMVGLG